MLLPVFGLIQSGQKRVLAEDADFWAYLVAFYNGIGLEPVSILLATSFLAILLRQVFAISGLYSWSGFAFSWCRHARPGGSSAFRRPTFPLRW